MRLDRLRSARAAAAAAAAAGGNGGGASAAEPGEDQEEMRNTLTRTCANEGKNSQAKGNSAKRGDARRGKDANDSIRISLEQHAERVAKKQRTSGGGESREKTAAQRLADLRARVMARSSMDKAATAEESGEARANMVVEDVEEGARAMDILARRNELPKIHFPRGEDARRIHEAPACRGGGGDTARAKRCEVSAARESDLSAGTGRPGTSSDAAHEASRVAWHGVAPVTEQPR
jgi:hypothetical protein